MKRDRTLSLVHWLNSNARKPLIIRGARQVGKTWLIRDLAVSQERRLIELNPSSPDSSMKNRSKFDGFDTTT